MVYARFEIFRAFSVRFYERCENFCTPRIMDKGSSSHLFRYRVLNYHPRQGQEKGNVILPCNSHSKNQVVWSHARLWFYEPVKFV